MLVLLTALIQAVSIILSPTKLFELGVNFSFDFGGKVRSQPTYSIVDFDKGRNTNRDILNRWTPENTETIFPVLLSQNERLDEYMWYSNQNEIYRNLDIWIRDLNYVRLQNIRLGYTLPTNFTRTLGMTSATVAIEDATYWYSAQATKTISIRKPCPMLMQHRLPSL